MPYEIGAYRSEWERYPVLVRQYHPDLNRNITLTQIPPAAEVYLTWQCDAGHLFVATPDEQRHRPGGVRRRSSWCPDCLALAAPKRIVNRHSTTAPSANPPRTEPTALDARGSRSRPTDAAPQRAAPRPRPVHAPVRPTLAGPTPGEAFHSGRAPRPASAAEGELRSRLAKRIDLDLRAANAVGVRRPFFTHREVWPDIVLPELKVAIEYDTIGRFGLEHVGTREATDRRKDRLLREAGWEVIRVRCGKLNPLGPYDLQAGAVTDALVERLLDRLREIRGDLFVNAYLR
ncbi:putative zinc ribbon protein [Subtercola boreus]|nr:putative zinc ribbon protein [Subtercola boreus]